MSPDCKQRYEAEGINHVVCSRRGLREKRGRLVLEAQGYIHAPKSSLFPDGGMQCTVHGGLPVLLLGHLPMPSLGWRGAAGLRWGDAAAYIGGGPCAPPGPV